MKQDIVKQGERRITEAMRNPDSSFLDIYEKRLD
jgi:hypothetical protein